MTAKKSSIRRKSNPGGIPWLEVKQRYLAGEGPTQIAKTLKKFNIKPKTISDKASREKWREQRSEFQGDVRTISKELLLSDRFNTIEEIANVTNMSMAVIKEFFERKEYYNNYGKINLKDIRDIAEIARILNGLIVSTEDRKVDKDDSSLGQLNDILNQSMIMFNN